MSSSNRKQSVPYSIEIAKEICKEIATCTKGLDTICKEHPHWPVKKTICEWRVDYPEFREMFFHAKCSQADLLAEEIIEISDDSSRDILTKQNSQGEEYEASNLAMIARARLRVDSRKWMATKLIPKTYGDKAQDDATKALQELTNKLNNIYELNEKCKLKDS